MKFCELGILWENLIFEVKTFFKKNNNFDYLINLHGANEQVVKKNENINLVFKNDLENFPIEVSILIFY